MTEDTKRALDAIRPIAEVLSIEVSARDNFLYCDGQAIGIACNSTYATVNEFIGYAMIRMCEREYRFKMDKKLEKCIKLYWFSDAQLKQMEVKKNA